MANEIALLWYGKVARGDHVNVPGEAGIWVVRKVHGQGEGFSAILVRRTQPTTEKRG